MTYIIKIKYVIDGASVAEWLWFQLGVSVYCGCIGWNSALTIELGSDSFHYPSQVLGLHLLPWTSPLVFFHGCAACCPFSWANNLFVVFPLPSKECNSVSWWFAAVPCTPSPLRILDHHSADCAAWVAFLGSRAMAWLRQGFEKLTICLVCVCECVCVCRQYRYSIFFIVALHIFS